MLNIKEGKLNGRGKKFCVAVSRFNDSITTKLIDGAISGLTKCGVTATDIDIVRVPGAFELPLIIKKMAHSKKYHGIVCIGTVIAGATKHNEYISAEVIKGISSLMLSTDIPITLGVITCNTIEEAMERSGAKMGNRGYEAALTCVEMVNLLEETKL